jgi:N-acyl-phosphatidylethanolamine-hydrolysing phospholipase D
MPSKSGSEIPTRRKGHGVVRVCTMIACSMTLVLLWKGVPSFCPVNADESLQDRKEHHSGEGFRNAEEGQAPGVLDFLRWRWERLFQKSPPWDAYHFPLAANDPAFLRANADKATLTWIGHATVLLQLQGTNILTDPHFSQRASPVQWAGPVRFVPPGVALEDLPTIDIVVISHDHYDSLDRDSILRLHSRPGGARTAFFAPLGLKKWFQDLGIANVYEMDWWDRRQEGALEIIAVPVKHWSKRSLFGRNRTLWTGWIIRSPGFRFFFTGDSGYTGVFQEIGRRFGPFDLAAIPIGAYEPRWFMRHHHISPEEAVRVHQDVRAKRSVAIHWGTFRLTDEPLDEPPKALDTALGEAGIPREDFRVLKHGETIVLDSVS